MALASAGHPETYLATGTNELKMLEFRSGSQRYGINILKVNRVLSSMASFCAVPECHPAIRGVFREQEHVVPVIDLSLFLEGRETDLDGKFRVVVAEFFGMLNGFLVDDVESVHDVAWSEVIDAQRVLDLQQNPYVISIVRPREECMVQILDYETIIMELSPEVAERALPKETDVVFQGQGRRVLVAEDSLMVRGMLERELTANDFQVTLARDGQEALETLGDGAGFDLVISDIEMPRLDGLALTRTIKEDRKLAHLPVVIFSSIGDQGMKQRAKVVKADAHVTKLEVGELLSAIETALLAHADGEA